MYYGCFDVIILLIIILPLLLQLFVAVWLNCILSYSVILKIK